MVWNKVTLYRRSVILLISEKNLYHKITRSTLPIFLFLSYTILVG